MKLPGGGIPCKLSKVDDQLGLCIHPFADFDDRSLYGLHVPCEALIKNKNRFFTLIHLLHFIDSTA